MLQKYLKLVLSFCILFYGIQITAQEAPVDSGKKYILADVNITNKVSYNKQTIITFSGLEKGKEITVPGEEISNAIKKLSKLGFFDEISFYINRIQNDSIYLDLELTELPKLNEVRYIGIKKGKAEDLTKDNALTRGKTVNENLITTTKNYIEKKYKKDGFYNVKVNITTPKDTSAENTVNMLIRIDKGAKVKVSSIDFVDNKNFTDKTLRGSMKNTKQRNFFRLFKRSKYIKDKYAEDLVRIIDKYKEKGYRDARIISDSVVFNNQKEGLDITIKVEEGDKYYFGDIKFIGNSVYPDNLLYKILGIKKGDVYNGVLLEKRISDKTKPDGEDISNLYQNNGYLFSNVNAVEVKTTNNIIDFEIRIVEGKIAYLNNITVTGNDRTYDRVIYRELRTRPGQKYSKENIVNTMREIGQLGFFDPEALQPNIKNVDAEAGTVDIEYPVVEKGSSQIELQGGYGGTGFVGTLGLSFNNFSARNIFNGSAYRPLPMGDGQKMSLRAQASSFYNTYSLSFTEPWFGGRKPIQFSFYVSYSKQYLYNYRTYTADKSKYFGVFTSSIGLAKRLRFPDDYFTLSQSLMYQQYELHNYYNGLFTFGDGTSKNIAYTIGLSRNNKGINPIFPTRGSEISVSLKLTPPYSKFSGTDYATLGEQEEYKYKYNGSSYEDSKGNIVKVGDYLDAVPSQTNPYPNKVDTYQEGAADPAKVDQEKFKWLEYYKVKFKADWYSQVYGKLVLRTLAEFGFLGSYNDDIGIVPFERFYLGGDGMQSYSMDGRETVQLRGYPNYSLTPINTNGEQVGATIYNKFSLELRYPITLKAAASVYGLTFLEAGSSFASAATFNPFELSRSAGLGLRVFMPAFGLLGIDFGYGFDPIPGFRLPNGWETHFIIGQQF